MHFHLSLHRAPLKWLQHKLTKRQFLTISAVFIGLSAGLAAVLLKSLVHFVHQLLTVGLPLQIRYIVLFVAPLLGVLLTVWIVTKFFKGESGFGLGGVLKEIAQKAGFVTPSKMYSQIITATTTVGLGGSTGLEAPIVVTGSAIGANYARAYHVNQKDRYVLLAAGAAAGIAAVFNAPIAGFIFAIEVLLVDVSIAEFIPLIVAAVSGALCSNIILNDGILFEFGRLASFSYHNTPFYILMGIGCGFVSIYYGKLRHLIDVSFEPLKNKPYAKALIGGGILALLCIAFPQLFGEGYESVKALTLENPKKLFEDTILIDLTTNPWFILLFIGLVGTVKALATAITISSGGNGGNFAPSMFVGAYFGFFFSSIVNQLKITQLPVSNFSLVGMAGLISGIMYAPLTGIFLIAEITGGYQLIIPLMMVSALSFFITQHFEPVSPELKSMVEKGEILTANKDKNILILLRTSQIINRNTKVLYPEEKLSTIVKYIKTTSQAKFAVVNKYHELIGVVEMSDVKELMFQPELHESITVKELMKIPLATIGINDSMQHVMEVFEQVASTKLPVVDGAIFIGLISKSVVFNHYREALIEQSGV